MNRTIREQPKIKAIADTPIPVGARWLVLSERADVPVNHVSSAHRGFRSAAWSAYWIIGRVEKRADVELLSREACVACGHDPACGLAMSGDDRLCHPDVPCGPESRSCYERVTGSRGGFVSRYLEDGL